MLVKCTMEAASPPVEVEVEAHASTSVKPLSPSAFGVRIHLRTLMALNTNVMAGLITLGVLLALGDFMEGLDAIQRLGFILAPTLAAGLCGEPLVAALREERSGCGGEQCMVVNRTVRGFRLPSVRY